MTEVKSIFREKVTNNRELLTKISDWVESHLDLEPGRMDNDLNDIFKKIYLYYDFSDCSLIVDMCDEFVSDQTDLLDKLKGYSLKAKTFRSSRPIIDLKQKLCKVYGPYRRHLENMPLICIKLQNSWDKVKIKALKTLIKSLLPEEIRQSVMKCITIEEACVIIKLYILDFTANSLIQYSRRKLEFIRLIGIFSLYINDHPVLQDDENMNFTFELALLEAVTAGNNEAVEFLLQLETVNIDHTNEEGKTALMLASKGGHEDIVHSLLSVGANVNIQDNKGWTALMIASAHNRISIIRMLLQANANPHLKTSDGLNGLMIASYHGNYEVVQLFINKGVDYACQREDGWNAFMFACEYGHIQIVELLLNEQIDPNVQRNDGLNGFMLACQNGHAQIVKLLLNEKVDPNVQKKNGWNAFMVACKNGQIEIVEMLLKEKIDPNVQDKDGWTALMMACWNGHTEIVELLLKKNVNTNAREKNGWNAFMVVCENGHTQIVELLLKKVVKPNVQNKDGLNGFMLACQNGHIEIVKLLLGCKEKVNPNAQKINGWNGFMVACENGHTELAKLLLKEEASVKHAIIFACKEGNTALVEKLLMVGVDPNVQDRKGYTPLMIAIAKGHVEIAKSISQWSPDSENQANDGQSICSSSSRSSSFYSMTLFDR